MEVWLLLVLACAAAAVNLETSPGFITEINADSTTYTILVEAICDPEFTTFEVTLPGQSADTILSSAIAEYNSSSIYPAEYRLCVGSYGPIEDYNLYTSATTTVQMVVSGVDVSLPTYTITLPATGGATSYEYASPESEVDACEGYNGTRSTISTGTIGVMNPNIIFCATASPTGAPTQAPTEGPTAAPTVSPTFNPTRNPVNPPTASPTDEPTGAPTAAPTDVPTGTPTTSPTGVPTGVPTGSPTGVPTGVPTAQPTTNTTSTPRNPSEPKVSPGVLAAIVIISVFFVFCVTFFSCANKRNPCRKDLSI